MARDQWNTKVGFILAAIGSAIGLGNIWRFPYATASNGGGAFLIPYLFALITAGIPIMILEFAVGHKFRSSTPFSLAKMNKKWEWVGWFQAAVAFIITTYYIAIIAWALSYVFKAFTLAWGADPKAYFFGEYLGLTNGPWELGGIQWSVFIPMVLVWIVTYFILSKGIASGIEKANKVLIPSLMALIAVIVVRGLTLPGAVDGLNFLFTPDWSAIGNPKIWVAAYGQIFFSLSIAFAIMITYSSYLPEKTDIVNSAFITSFANCGFSLFAALGVFGVLGYMAYSQGVPVQEVASAGVGLAFVVFPKAISALPAMQGIIGAIFFVTLLFAGMSSLISIIEAYLAAVKEKFDYPREKALKICIAVAFICSVFFTTGAGLYLLDIVDHWINNVGIVLGGLLEVILIGWFFNLEEIREHANSMSDFAVGSWWNIMIKYVSPIIIGYMMIMNIINEFKVPYEGYESSALTVFGWGSIIACIILAFVFYTLKGSEQVVLKSDKEVSK